MPTTLRQVLQAFEETRAPRTLSQLARELDLPPSMLEGMIDHWVRKGRLRETGSGPACTTCGHSAGCPFIAKMPRSFELATDDGDASPPPGHCCGQGVAPLR
ncbi:MAG: helix-turn-helix domain-containing protein [Anaerolineae bacterium]|nr:helix-turn-helix domain-containing protein [Anaerolineae bacterium]